MNQKAMTTGVTEPLDRNVTVTPLDQAQPLVAEADRTITGRVLPWGELGRTSQGALAFPKGSINVPADISRVKLLAGHSPSGVPVGHATSWESREDGLYMSFKVGSSSAAAEALTAAAEHVIDAFSIEAYGIERRGTQVEKSILSAVALVPLPAFANARVDTVNASAPSEADPVEDDEQEEPSEVDPVEDDEQEEPSEADPAEDTEQEDDTMTNNTTGLIPGTLPGEHKNATPTQNVHASFDDVLGYLTASVNGSSTDNLLAELTDITDAGMIDRAAPQWLGELWNGVTYQREIIPLLTQAPLKSRKAVGYTWTTKPGVDKYSGNKTEIPSKPAAVEAVEREAERWAGGNDLDRAFWDFGETEFLNAYWRAMAESYAFETDQNAAEFLVENATAIDGTADNLIHGVARGSIKIKHDLKTSAGFVLINPADYESILQLSMLDAPKFLDLIPAMDPAKWVATDFVAKGTAIVGTKPAVTHFELSGSPLRVEAEHIARGGRDAALFGYTALMLNRPEGLVAVKFGDTPTTPNPAE